MAPPAGVAPSSVTQCIQWTSHLTEYASYPLTYRFLEARWSSPSRWLPVISHGHGRTTWPRARLLRPRTSTASDLKTPWSSDI